MNTGKYNQAGQSKLVGAVVGKALEPLREGTGVVQVLVTLQ
jgi:hypothetical protein